MRLSKAWIIAAKDFRIFSKKRSIIYTVVGFEIFVSVGLPLLLKFSDFRKGIPRHLPSPS